MKLLSGNASPLNSITILHLGQSAQIAAVGDATASQCKGKVELCTPAHFVQTASKAIMRKGSLHDAAKRSGLVQCLSRNRCGSGLLRLGWGFVLATQTAQKRYDVLHTTPT
jgi:hypothetical protein